MQLFLQKLAARNVMLNCYLFLLVCHTLKCIVGIVYRFVTACCVFSLYAFVSVISNYHYYRVVQKKCTEFIAPSFYNWLQ